MAINHSPAPWKASKTDDDEVFVFPTGPWSHAVARLYARKDEAERLANAALIAAAPELLEALECLLSFCPAETEVQDRKVLAARAALRKARGEAS